MKLSFENLRAANVRRGAQWDGKPAALDDLSFRAMELGGETGEALNFCKKLVRFLSGRKGGLTQEAATPKIAEELADVVICADRVAEVLGVDLETAITEKFNKTSLKHGLVMIEECMTDGDLDRLMATATSASAEDRAALEAKGNPFGGAIWSRIDALERENARLGERRTWWQKNAEAIAEERGELFRAGEAMRAAYVAQIGTEKSAMVEQWDAAAQPIRDMIASLPKPEKHDADWSGCATSRHC